MGDQSYFLYKKRAKDIQVSHAKVHKNDTQGGGGRDIYCQSFLSTDFPFSVNQNPQNLLITKNKN